MEVSAAVFARMCGVNRSAICLLKKSNSPKLVFNSAGKLDTDNPVNRMYLEQKQAKMKEKIALSQMEAAVRDGGGFGASAPLPNGVPPVGEPSRGNASLSENQQRGGAENIASAGASVYPGEKKAIARPMPSGTAAEMLRLPVGQLVRKFGSVDAIEKYSKILRDLSTTDEREQRTQEKRMLQIPKDFVVQRVFGYVDSLMNQLLDVPESVSDQVIAVALAGGDDVRVKVMRILSDNLTRCIAGAKEHIVGELNTLKGKYDRQENAAVDLREQLEEMREVG